MRIQKEFKDQYNYLKLLQIKAWGRYSQTTDMEGDQDQRGHFTITNTIVIAFIMRPKLINNALL